MSFLHRKHCCLLPPGWSLTLRRLLSLLAAILRESTTDSIKPSFSPWRSCSAQNSAHRRLVFSSCSWFTVWKQHSVLHNLAWRPQEPVLTLRHLWASGYQVILSYDSQTAVGHQELWPAVPYWWANQRTAQDVISYLDCKKDLGRPGGVYTLAHIFSVILVLSHEHTKLYFFFSFFLTEGFFVCGLNLTADRYYITENLKQSLRTLTFSNWECLKKWLKEQRPGSDPQSLNIIAGDFVGPLPLCSLVIALNQKLLKRNAIRWKTKYYLGLILFHRVWSQNSYRILHLLFTSVILYALSSTLKVQCVTFRRPWMSFSTLPLTLALHRHERASWASIKTVTATMLLSMMFLYFICTIGYMWR